MRKELTVDLHNDDIRCRVTRAVIDLLSEEQIFTVANEIREHYLENLEPIKAGTPAGPTNAVEADFEGHKLWGLVVELSQDGDTVQVVFVDTVDNYRQHMRERASLN